MIEFVNVILATLSGLGFMYHYVMYKKTAYDSSKRGYTVEKHLDRSVAFAFLTMFLVLLLAVYQTFIN